MPPPVMRLAATAAAALAAGSPRAVYGPGPVISVLDYPGGVPDGKTGSPEGIQAALQGGSEPDTPLKESYEEAVGRLQSNPTYQRLVSAQANFDKVLLKVNRTIQEGIAEGAESRIILP